MRVAHLLRKYNPAEWGGTETALERLFAALPEVTPIIYCPQRNGAAAAARDPFAEAGYPLRHFRARVPIWGLTPERKRQLIAVGGNLMSFDLPVKLWREPELALIHTHALGRIGAIGRAVARGRGLPLVVTIHGGVLDVPDSMKRDFQTPPSNGWEWGKVFGWLLQSRRLLADADAILTCNPREAELLRASYPDRRIQVQPHGVSLSLFQKDCRDAAYQAFPQLRGRRILLAAGRIDPVKNQGWLLDHLPMLLRRHSKIVLVLAGACTDMAYGGNLVRQVQKLGLEQQILLTGGLSPGDPRLLGLFQSAATVLLPSISETFGLVILEAWAAGAVPIASRTSGALALIQPGRNGWLFDLADPAAFYTAIDQTLNEPETRERLANAGRELVCAEYDTGVLARKIKCLYEQLTEQKRALRHPARR